MSKAVPCAILQEASVAVNLHIGVIERCSEAREIAALQHEQTNDDSAGYVVLFKLRVSVVQLAARRRHEVLNTVVKGSNTTFLHVPDSAIEQLAAVDADDGPDTSEEDMLHSAVVRVLEHPTPP